MIAVVHGALTSFVLALIVMVAQSWPAESDYDGSLDMWMCTCFDSEPPTIPSACDDYAPAPPADGAWCGVHIDDRYPLRDDSFPTIELDTP